MFQYITRKISSSSTSATASATSTSSATTTTTTTTTTTHDRSRRHSHEPQTSTELSTNFRHTQSQHYDRKMKKIYRKSAEPVILETEDTEPLGNQEVRISITNADEMRLNRQKLHRHSHESQISHTNVGFVPDNDGLPSSNSSAANSIRSSSRHPSLQSLTVVREQYWCCAQRSPCERVLIASIAVLTFIIIMLVIVVGILAVQHSRTS